MWLLAVVFPDLIREYHRFFSIPNPSSSLHWQGVHQIRQSNASPPPAPLLLHPPPPPGAHPCTNDSNMTYTHFRFTMLQFLSLL